MPTPYLSETEAPERASVNALPGLTLLEFGTNWCGHCRAAQTLVAQALAAFPQWQHLKIEDGSGRALGRSFRVTLWPTLIFLREGQELSRLVRPASVQDIQSAMSKA